MTEASENKRKSPDGEVRVACWSNAVLRLNELQIRMPNLRDKPLIRYLWAMLAETYAVNFTGCEIGCPNSLAALTESGVNIPFTGRDDFRKERHNAVLKALALVCRHELEWQFYMGEPRVRLFLAIVDAVGIVPPTFRVDAVPMNFLFRSEVPEDICEEGEDM